MKKRISVSLLLFFSVLLLCMPATVHAKGMRLKSLKANMNSVTVKWSKKKGAAKYVVYRADTTASRNTEAPFPAKSAYKKIKVIKGAANTKFTDKKVKKNRYYSYYIAALNKKGKEIANSYSSMSLSYICKGLGQPNLLNGGSGEFHTNSRKKLYLYVEPDFEASDASGSTVVVYRKTEGGKKYKKIGSTSLTDGVAEYVDKTVKTGKVYQYRVQLVKTVNGKKVKSKKSAALRIPAVSFTASYQVKCLTPAATVSGQAEKELSFSLTDSGKYNGTTTILPGEGSYEYAGKYYDFRLSSYSTDGKNWKELPKDGVKLPKKGTLRLKGVILKGEEAKIVFGGSKSGSVLYNDGGFLTYDGPGVGFTDCTLNFATGKGRAFKNFD